MNKSITRAILSAVLIFVLSAGAWAQYQPILTKTSIETIPPSVEFVSYIYADGDNYILTEAEAASYDPANPVANAQGCGLIKIMIDNFDENEPGSLDLQIHIKADGEYGAFPVPIDYIDPAGLGGDYSSITIQLSPLALPLVDSFNAQPQDLAVKLDWQPEEGVFYKVFRKVFPAPDSGLFKRIAEDANPPYLDLGSDLDDEVLVNGNTYYYMLVAEDSDGRMVHSAVFSAEPGPQDHNAPGVGFDVKEVETAEGNAVVIDLEITDDGDSLELVMEGEVGLHNVQDGSLSEFIKQGNTWVVTYAPDDVNFNGSDSFTFKVKDNTNPSVPVYSSDQATVNIDITPVNDGPVLTISLVDPQIIPLDQTLTVMLSATDIDTDQEELSYDDIYFVNPEDADNPIPYAEKGASFDPETKTFSWTPTAEQLGEYTIQFIVNDNDVEGPLSDTKELQVSVEKVLIGIAIDPDVVEVAAEGTQQFTVTANYNDGIPVNITSDLAVDWPTTSAGNWDDVTVGLFHAGTLAQDGVVLTVEYQEKPASADLTIVAGVLDKLEIKAVDAEGEIEYPSQIAAGEIQEFKLTKAEDKDFNPIVLTDADVTWMTSAGSINVDGTLTAAEVVPEGAAFEVWAEKLVDEAVVTSNKIAITLKPNVVDQDHVQIIANPLEVKSGELVNLSAIAHDIYNNLIDPMYIGINPQTWVAPGGPGSYPVDVVVTDSRYPDVSVNKSVNILVTETPTVLQSIVLEALDADNQVTQTVLSGGTLTLRATGHYTQGAVEFDEVIDEIDEWSKTNGEIDGNVFTAPVVEIVDGQVALIAKEGEIESPELSITVKVDTPEENDAPTLSLNPADDQVVSLGDPIADVVLSVADDNPEHMTYSVYFVDLTDPENPISIPLEEKGAAFNEETKTFSWTPLAEHVGSHTIHFEVNDNDADDPLSDVKEINVLVNKVLLGIEIDPVAADIVVGHDQQFTVKANYNNSDTLVLITESSELGWPEKQAGVWDWEAGTKGLFKAGTQAQAEPINLEVTFGDKSANAVVNIVADVLADDGLAIAAVDDDQEPIHLFSQIAAGETQAFKVTKAEDQHGNPVDKSVTWNTSLGLGTIDEDGTLTSATAVPDEAAFKVWAEQQVGEEEVVKSNEIEIQLIPNVLDSVEIIPEQDEILPETYVSLNAEGFDVYGNIINGVTWTPLGWIAPETPGTYQVEVTVTDNRYEVQKKGSASIKVTETPKVLASIELEASGSTVEEGKTLTLTATGHYTQGDDETEEDITDQIEKWTASDGSIVDGVFTAPSVDEDTDVTIQALKSEKESNILTINVTAAVDPVVVDPVVVDPVVVDPVVVDPVVVDPVVVNNAPVANAKAVETNEDADADIQLNGTDADEDAITYAVVSEPTHGTLSNSDVNAGVVIYTPDANYAGIDSFTFKVNDGELDSAAATVIITVNAVNDAPVLAEIGSKTVVATKTLEFEISAIDIDAQIDALIYSATDLPQGAALQGKSFTWTPTTDQTGEHQITFVVNDSIGAQSSETVLITVNELIAEVTIQTDENNNISVKAVDAEGNEVLNVPLATIKITGADDIDYGSELPAEDGSYMVTATVALKTKALVAQNIINVNTSAPKISVNLTADQIVDSGYKVEAEASDGNGIAEISVIVDGVEVYKVSAFASDSETVTKAYCSTELELSAGTHTIKVVATDALGSEDSVSISGVTVYAEVSVLTTPKNYPNPFKPASGQSTTINFSLSKAAGLKLSVYDLSGRLIHSQAYTGVAGENEITWDGKNAFGQVVGNGAYIYFISADGQVIGKGGMAIHD